MQCADIYDEVVARFKSKFYQDNKADIWWLWKPIGECHNMGEILLYLAKQVEPTEDWRIQCSIAHTTVWNGNYDHPKFFDLNFFWESCETYKSNKESKWIPCSESYGVFMADLFGISDDYIENITNDYIIEYNETEDHQIKRVTNHNLPRVIRKLSKKFF